MTPTSETVLLDIRPMWTSDLRSIAALHAATLPNGFFARLGSRFLRVYYSTFIHSPHAVALTATMDGRPVGMVVGPARTAHHYRWVARRRGSRLALIGIGALAYRPRLLSIFLRTRARRYAGAARKATTAGSAPQADRRRGAVPRRDGR